MIEGINGNQELWNEVQKQFEQIKLESGIDPDEGYQKELEELLGMSFEEMNTETEIAMKTRPLKLN